MQSKACFAGYSLVGLERWAAVRFLFKCHFQSQIAGKTEKPVIGYQKLTKHVCQAAAGTGGREVKQR
jgi:hypothetical protein